MNKLMTGNEAIARGAYEAGVSYACAYPGTPSTEILETINETYKETIISEWAPNEKVALEAAIGASMVGGRSLAAMKMVGVNVAADPLMSFSYSGVNGGFVLVTADDPGLHSSQNEQDNRYYAKFAKIAMLEPSDSQEAKDMVVAAMKISETFDTPVLLRVTTRICHSKSLVELGEAIVPTKKTYVKNKAKNDLVPDVSRRLHVILEQKLKDLEAFSNTTELNYEEMNDTKIGIITSSVAYQYAKEVFGDTVSYLKLGFTFPLPMDKIRTFSEKVDILYVIEELEPFMEEQIKAAGIACTGKEKIPNVGELNPEIIGKVLKDMELPLVEYDNSKIANRPPTMCAGCPHRGFFYELSKRKNVMISGDIGCYGLGGSEPLNAKDGCVCMGASISVAHGAQKMFDRYEEPMRVVATIGDSTFFHTGINSLMHTAYNKSNTITCILDNRITGMTGHQENPGSGFTLSGMPTKMIEIEALVRAIGIEEVRTVNPLDLTLMKETFDWAFDLDVPSVIITRYPCVLKKYSEEDKKEFGDHFGQCHIIEDKCIGCRMCVKTGCPALRYDKDKRKVEIDRVQCVGCEVCKQVCKFDAIERVGE